MFRNWALWLLQGVVDIASTHTDASLIGINLEDYLGSANTRKNSEIESNCKPQSISTNMSPQSEMRYQLSTLQPNLSLLVTAKVGNIALKRREDLRVQCIGFDNSQDLTLGSGLSIVMTHRTDSKAPNKLFNALMDSTTHKSNRTSPFNRSHREPILPKLPRDPLENPLCTQARISVRMLPYSKDAYYYSCHESTKQNRKVSLKAIEERMNE